MIGRMRGTAVAGTVRGVYLVTVLGRRSDPRCCYGRCEAATSKKPPRMAGVTK